MGKEISAIKKISSSINKSVSDNSSQMIVIAIISGAYSIYQFIKENLGGKVSEDDIVEVEKRALLGLSVGAKAASFFSKIFPSHFINLCKAITVPVFGIILALGFAVIPALYYKYYNPQDSDKDKDKDNATFKYVKLGINIGGIIAAGLIAIACNHIGLSIADIAGIGTAGFAVGATSGAIAMSSICKRYVENDKSFFDRISTGITWGALIVCAVGGLVGNFIPGIGAVLGSSIGAAIGAAILGTAAVKLPIIHKYFKSKSLQLCTKISMAVGAAIGATIGSVVPILGTAIGSVIGGALGTLVGAAGYQFYKYLKKTNEPKISTNEVELDTLRDDAENSITSETPEKKPKNFLVNQIKNSVSVYMFLGAAIGLAVPVPVLGSVVGAGIGALTGLAWVGFRKVTEGTKIDQAIEQASESICHFFSKAKKFIANKITNVFKPKLISEIELENFTENSYETIDENSEKAEKTYSKVQVMLPYKPSLKKAKRDNPGDSESLLTILNKSNEKMGETNINPTSFWEVIPTSNNDSFEDNCFMEKHQIIPKAF